MAYTFDETIKELERELSVRKRVYPDWVRMQKISQATADERIILLQNAINLLKRQGGIQTNMF